LNQNALKQLCIVATVSEKRHNVVFDITINRKMGNLEALCKIEQSSE